MSPSASGTADVDRVCLTRRAELLAFLGGDEEVVNEALLRVQMYGYRFDNDEHLIAWCRFVGASYARTRDSLAWVLDQLPDATRTALVMRSQGHGDVQIALRVRGPVEQIPELLRDARQQAERLVAPYRP